MHRELDTDKNRDTGWNKDRQDTTCGDWKRGTPTETYRHRDMHRLRDTRRYTTTIIKITAPSETDRNGGKRRTENHRKGPNYEEAKTAGRMNTNTEAGIQRDRRRWKEPAGRISRLSISHVSCSTRPMKDFDLTTWPSIHLSSVLIRFRLGSTRSLWSHRSVSKYTRIRGRP